jgi:2-aminoadipate transaminase
MQYDAYWSRAAHAMAGSAIRKMGTVSVRVPGLISFAPGYPSPDSFPWDECRAITGDLLAERRTSALQYGPTRGFAPLVDAIVEVLGTRRIASRPDQVLITTGSQQGLDLVARVLLDPGDVALVELPTYTGAITAFRDVQAQLVGVRQDADGIDLDHLDRTVAHLRAEGRRVRLLYLVPNFQNPTGLLMSRARRLEVLEAAARHDLLLVEDDPYGDLYFDEGTGPDDTRPIKADDTDGRVIYLSSFSKTLAPGFRVAWLVAGEALAAKLEVAKQAADICTGALDQHIVWQAIVRGVLGAQGPRLRALYRERRDVMERALRTQLGDVLRWREPAGGFFLWAALPDAVDAEAMLERATTAHRVIYVVGNAFFVDGGGRNLVRLSFSQPSPREIEEGVSRLAAAVHEELGAGARAGATGTGGASRGTSTPRG